MGKEFYSGLTKMFRKVDRGGGGCTTLQLHQMLLDSWPHEKLFYVVLQYMNFF